MEKKPEPERKIIKFDTPATPSPTKPAVEKTPGASADAAREELEQRRNILQNMKDFDFQIKKNQEDITTITNKVESLSKDLDDLVSLYEIVSEQMNPFVGLSKVTKKRLDALENIIKEVDGVKTKLGDLEAVVEKNNMNNNNNMVSPIPRPTVQPEKKQEPSTQPTTMTETPTKPPIASHSTMTEQVNETELDKCLASSLESLLLEQNINAMINEFFINLK
ncbi:MAG: hypothetical protein JW840_10385 [Candidatus Thermoplasmatota archaeon]|nr:hypothetical protein [Candidatus Thermoplasmatota archaeon]